MKNDITTLELLNIVLWFGYLIFIILLTVVKHDSLWKMIVGEDNIPQPIEGFLALWFITTPIFVVSIMAFGVEPPTELYTLLEIVGPAGVAGMLGKEISGKLKNKKDGDTIS